MNTTDALQILSLIMFLGVLALCWAAWGKLSQAGRYYLVPVATYALHGALFYTVVTFFQVYTTGEMRMLWSVVLRLHSVILAGSYVAIYAWPRKEKK